MSTNKTLEAAIERLRLDFVEGSLERLDELEGVLMALRAHDESFADRFLDLQRHIHSIKGQGSTFDFPAVTQIAHRLEDFIEVSPRIGDSELDVIQIYLDRIRAILESGVNPPASALASLLRPDDLDPASITKSQQVRVVEMLLIMPKGLQRKIIGEELASCGFRVSMTEDPVAAIGQAIALKPDIIFATQEMAGMTGLELAQVLQIINATRGRRFILLTSADDAQIRRDALPPDTAIVHKGARFTEELMHCLVAWGLFGDWGAVA